MRAASLAVLICLIVVRPSWAASSGIVAAENFYGDVAGQIAGPDVAVTSILSNPEQDPHLFEASPSTARALTAARLVIYNGADYDPWMAALVRATRSPGRVVLVAAELVHRGAGVNPHLWYDLDVMPAVAAAIAEALSRADPAHASAYAQRLAAFEESLSPLRRKVAAMRARVTGSPVTATEPVFGYMAASLGLEMRNQRFQLAIMNGTEPRPSDVAAFEADLNGRRVRVLIYNAQASSPTTERMRQLAQAAHIPILGVTETEPAGSSYQAWMMSQLEALDRALGTTP